MNILVVEDEQPVAEYLQRALTELGITSLLAPTADEADEILERHEVDAVTLDLAMPGRGGKEPSRPRRYSHRPLASPATLDVVSSSSIAPALLVAMPQLLDPNFRKSVVLLLNKDEQGALGVVINRESQLLLKDLCLDHEINYGGKPDKKVRSGGPVQPEHGLVLYGPEHSDPEGRTVIEGLFVSSSKETLSRLCNLEDGRFHCYAGYAGWGPQQLDNEIRVGSWIVAPADPALVLDAPTEDLWLRSLQSVGIDPAVLVPGGLEEA